MSQETLELSRKIAQFAGWKKEAGEWYFPGSHFLPQSDAPDFAGGTDTCLAYLTDVLGYICLAWLKTQKLWTATVFMSTKEPAYTASDPDPSMAICRAVEKLIDAKSV